MILSRIAQGRHSGGFLPAQAAFWWRKQLLKKPSDDNDPHVKVVDFFMPETMAMPV